MFLVREGTALSGIEESPEIKSFIAIRGRCLPLEPNHGSVLLNGLNQTGNSESHFALKATFKRRFRASNLVLSDKFSQTCAEIALAAPEAGYT